MLVKTFGSAVSGVDAITISIEVNVTIGTHTFLVGLPDNAVKESMLRVESAIKAIGFFMPRTKVIINMAPADIRKTGTAFDLPIAIGILAATDQLLHLEALQHWVLCGELGLDGSIQTIRGALPMAITARKEGFHGIMLPLQNANEAAVVESLPVIGVGSLLEVVQLLEEPGNAIPLPANQENWFNKPKAYKEGDFSDVKGQETIKRAMEIAAAGGHNLILVGPPGAGKTMLARRLPTILPPLTVEEALETTRIHSVAGKLNSQHSLICERPFRQPHHTISYMAMAGGGSNPLPGELSLAHNGVLFLDELPEFNRSVLEVMRQPMEERKLTISRAKLSVEFPAAFMLVASMNPCPCGYYNHPDKDCTCLPGTVQKYLQKISGPLLDRIDLQIEVTPVPFQQLSGSVAGELSEQIRKRVVNARKIQEERLRTQPGIYCNAQLSSALMKQHCVLNQAARELLRTAMERLKLSARAYDRILKMSRTIADLAQTDQIMPEHIAEAIQYRSLDRDNWGWK
ncbi:YifB family Mg chelatase-like AAA ATPase [Flavihumibacter sp. CACIAM 22H1]|uniref:YifB family Mg chelatase-like AAA ATPase n=1 Tax=Flavihumibacter sp. CACIAM 22H1 TaxID=1812911 RepID=UPI0007A8C403|nr:YifB family Mg chelatase-like AAA ATPase [Flavihumibacter sp. CACIAM 22H1]KYP16484.1 MAG: magnesium chelatase [Flavihumibacter sp. CACIAM 22H1]